MTRPSEDRLKPYIQEMQLQFLKDSARVYPCHTNRASEAGHPCSRYLTYCRTHWKERQAPDPQRMALYTLGNDIEDIVLNNWCVGRLKKYGLEIVRPKNQDWKDEPTGTTGHLDCFLQETQDNCETMWIPGEVKGVAAGTWDTVQTHGDMLISTRSWVRKWAVQLPFYCLMDSKPYGRYIFFSKESGRIRDFTVVLDDCIDLLHATTEKLKKVNEYVATQTVPPRFYEPGPPSPLCEDCDFAHICLPGSCYDESLRFMEDAVVEKLLVRYQELQQEIKAAKGGKEKELEIVKSQLGKFFENKPKVIIGGYLVTGKRIDVSAKKEGYSYWKWTVKGKGDE